MKEKHIESIKGRLFRVTFSEDETWQIFPNTEK